MNKPLINIVTACLAIICAGTACAGDMGPSAPTPIWSGFYAGGVVGGLWGKNSVGWSVRPEVPLPTISGNNNSSSIMGGVLAGFNYQFSPVWLGGIEGDWIWANSKGSLLYAPWVSTNPNVEANPNSFTAINSEINWMPSIKGRLGFLIQHNLMLFGAAGLSWANISYAANNANALSGTDAYATNAAFSKTSIGYTVGGGIEWATVYNILLRAEYLYYQFNSSQNVIAQDTTGNYPSFPSNYAWGKTSANTVRAGIAYKF